MSGPSAVATLLRASLGSSRFLARAAAPAFHTHANPHPGGDGVPGSWLVGTWRGEGKGEYPTVKDFSYTEQVCHHSRRIGVTHEIGRV